MIGLHALTKTPPTWKEVGITLVLCAVFLALVIGAVFA